MSASASEQLVARVAAVLTGLPGVTVARATGQRLAAADLPALVVARLATQHVGETTHAVQITTQFALEIFTRAGEGTETAADAIHLAAHARLIADGTLIALSRGGLTCLGSETSSDEMDAEYTRLEVRYSADSWIDPADFSIIT